MLQLKYPVCDAPPIFLWEHNIKFRYISITSERLLLNIRDRGTETGLIHYHCFTIDGQTSCTSETQSTIVGKDLAVDMHETSGQRRVSLIF